MALFEFLCNIQGEKPRELFTASCSIYSARPTVCRVYPLVKLDKFNYGPETISIEQKPIDDGQKVILNPKTVCPSIAFERGHKMTATQYLKRQQAHAKSESLEWNIKFYNSSVK